MLIRRRVVGRDGLLGRVVAWGSGHVDSLSMGRPQPRQRPPTSRKRSLAACMPGNHMKPPNANQASSASLRALTSNAACLFPLASSLSRLLRDLPRYRPVDGFGIPASCRTSSATRFTASRSARAAAMRVLMGDATSGAIGEPTRPIIIDDITIPAIPTTALLSFLSLSPTAKTRVSNPYPSALATSR